MFEAWLPLKTPLERLMWIRHIIGGGASWVWRTITGAAPLTLSNAVSHAIHSLTQYGLCTQASTPTPDAPVDIVCNNGALRYGAVGKNLVNITAADIEQGAISSADGSNSGSASHRVRTIGYYPVKPNTQYTISCVIDGYTSGSSKGVFILEYSSNSVSGYTGDSSGWKSPSGYAFTTGATTNFIRIVFAKGSSSSTPTIPEDVTNVQLEYGDTATEYEPFVGGVLADGTPEVLTVSADGAETQTVTNIPMLLSVGDYKDEAEIISGAVTHRIGYHVFDGTETFSKSSAYGQAFLINAAYTVWGADRTKAVLCTHFLGLPQKSGNQEDNTCFFNATGHFYFRVTDNSDINAWKAWLAEQYAAGTPVIVFFVLATEQTEQTTPHALHTVDGDNIVSWTYPGSTKTVEYAYQEPTNKVGSAKVGTAKAG